jgi:hypothetical protein
MSSDDKPFYGEQGDEMVTATMSLTDYRAEKAQRGVSADVKMKRLTGDSGRLRTHHWTDAQLLAIPEALVQFAFEQSSALQQEFGDLACFLAYRSARVHGLAGRRR